MNGKVVATNGRDVVPVKIYHWWPGRKWAGPCPIFDWLVERWELQETRYATIAIAHPYSIMVLYGSSACCPRDVPDRKLGRAIAMGRLAKELKTYGWRLEAA